MNVVFTVPEISCGHCKDTIESTLNNVAAIKSVSVDIEKKSTGMFAGLKIGDIIIKVDGVSIDSVEDINEINRQNFRKAGDEIQLEIWRQGTIKELNLQLKAYR